MQITCFFDHSVCLSITFFWNKVLPVSTISLWVPPHLWLLMAENSNSLGSAVVTALLSSSSHSIVVYRMKFIAVSLQCLSRMLWNKMKINEIIIKIKKESYNSLRAHSIDDMRNNRFTSRHAQQPTRTPMTTATTTTTQFQRQWHRKKGEKYFYH